MSQEKTNRRSLEAVLSGITRPAKAALFLRLLLKWWPEAKREQAGKFWIYRTREEWAEDLDVKLRTFDGHLEALRKGGWIETAKFKNLKSNGKPFGLPILHVRPTDKLLELVYKETGRGIDRPKKMGQAVPETAHNQCAEVSTQYKDTSYLHINQNKQENLKGTALPSVAPIAFQVLASGEKHTGKDNPPAPLAGSLPAIWKRAMEDCCPEAFAGLASVHVKMLADFGKACASGGLPEHAGNVLDWTVRNWTDFTKQAEQAAAAFKTPATPSPSFAVKYVNVAANAWLAEHKLVIVGGVLQPKQKASKSVLKIAKKPAPTPPAPTEPKPQSWEEVKAILYGD